MKRSAGCPALQKTCVRYILPCFGDPFFRELTAEYRRIQDTPINPICVAHEIRRVCAADEAEHVATNDLDFSYENAPSTPRVSDVFNYLKSSNAQFDAPDHFFSHFCNVGIDSDRKFLSVGVYANVMHRSLLSDLGVRPNAKLRWAI